MCSHQSDTTSTTRGSGEVRLFFVLTFLYTWVLWGLAAISRRDASKPPTALLHVLGGVGPSLVGAILVQTTEPKERRRDFWRRIADPRHISLPWYLAIAAVSSGPTLLTGMRRRKSDADETLDRGQAVQILMGAPISGLSEELGWRGYALERLQERHSALGASLLLGAIWSLWHAPLFFVKGTYQHRLGIRSREAPLFFALEIPRAVLATWIYNNTRRSILSAVLLHAAENASMGVTQGGRGVRLATLSGLSALVSTRWGPGTLVRQKR